MYPFDPGKVTQMPGRADGYDTRAEQILSAYRASWTTHHIGIFLPLFGGGRLPILCDPLLERLEVSALRTEIPFRETRIGDLRRAGKIADMECFGKALVIDALRFAPELRCSGDQRLIREVHHRACAVLQDCLRCADGVGLLRQRYAAFLLRHGCCLPPIR